MGLFLCSKEAFNVIIIKLSFFAIFGGALQSHPPTHPKLEHEVGGLELGGGLVPDCMSADCLDWVGVLGCCRS